MTLKLEFTGGYDAVQRNFDKLASAVWHPVPQARVYNNAAISLATSGTPQFLTFNSERWDTGALHSTSTNTGRLTAPVSGLYEIGAAVEFAANATGTRQIALAVGGATFIAVVEEQAVAVAGRPTALVIGTQYQLTAGDYVEVRASQSSGGALNVTANANFSPEFWMVRLAGFTAQVFE